MEYPRITHFCVVCGLDAQEPIWGENGHCPTYFICDCCGTEFGYEDATPESINTKREEWIKHGRPWFSDQKKPENWDIQRQMNNIIEEFR